MWFIGFILVAIMLISSGDTMKDLMCPHGSCFEVPIED